MLCGISVAFLYQHEVLLNKYQRCSGKDRKDDSYFSVFFKLTPLVKVFRVITRLFTRRCLESAPK